MSWAKLDDHANEHPKLLKAGAKAAWLWACGLMFCNRQAKKTGRIPKEKVPLLYPKLGVREAKKLVEVGLWIEGDDAYEVHDYKPWNPELRAKRAEAGREGGRRSGESRRAKQTKQNGKQSGSDDASENEASPGSTLDPPHPTPPQNSPPSPPEGESEAMVRWVFTCWAARFKKRDVQLDAKRATCIQARVNEGMTREDVIDALEGAARDDWCKGAAFKLTCIFGERERFEEFRDAWRDSEWRDPDWERRRANIIRRSLAETARDSLKHAPPNLAKPVQVTKAQLGALFGKVGAK